MYEKRNKDQSIAQNVKINEGMLFKRQTQESAYQECEQFSNPC